MLTTLDKAAVTYQIVLTKADQVKPAELAERIAATEARARQASRGLSRVASRPPPAAGDGIAAICAPRIARLLGGARADGRVLRFPACRRRPLKGSAETDAEDRP